MGARLSLGACCSFLVGGVAAERTLALVPLERRRSSCDGDGFSFGCSPTMLFCRERITCKWGGDTEPVLGLGRTAWRKAVRDMPRALHCNTSTHPEALSLWHSTARHPITAIACALSCSPRAPAPAPSRPPRHAPRGCR